MTGASRYSQLGRWAAGESRSWTLTKDLQIAVLLVLTTTCRDLVAAALAWRIAPPSDDDALALLGEDLIPLYVYYIDDHIDRLTAAGHTTVADAFSDWRDRITAA